MKFKVGDRVIYLGGKSDHYIMAGAIGTVSRFDTIGFCCSDWSKPVKNNAQYGWWVQYKECELAQPYLQKEEAKKLLGLKE